MTLVLPADHDAAVAVAEDVAAVDAGANAVRIRVKAVGVGLAGAAVLACHAGRERIVRDLDLCMHSSLANRTSGCRRHH